MSGGRDDSIEIDLEPLRATGERTLRVLDRFAGCEILGRLATVGAIEYLVARERSLTGGGRLVTIKRMRERAARGPELVRAFTRDARVSLRLSHPSLCTAYRIGVEGGVPFVTLELVHGIRVRDLIARAGTKGEVVVPAIAVAVTATVAEALHAGHVARARAGDVAPGPHQDLGVDDVMIGLDGTVKVLATPRDAATDVFALGILLHEMLTGRRPSARMLDHRAWPRAIPAGLAPVLDHALADDEAERYPSAAAMREDLGRWLERSGEPLVAARVAEAVAAVSDSGATIRPERRRGAFVALRGRDATGTIRLGRRGARSGRLLFAILVVVLVAIAIALSSNGVAS